MSDRASSPLDRFIATKQPKQLSDGQKIAYEAAELFPANERTHWLHIRFSDGDWALYKYNNLANVLSESSEHLALVFPAIIIEILGDNLRNLFDEFQAENVKMLIPFDHAHHIEPEPDAPRIKSIELKDASQLSS